MTLPTHYLVAALWQLWVLDLAPVAVTLRADANMVQVGVPLLLKVEAFNRSSTTIPGSHSLRSISGNVQFECRPPGESGYKKVHMFRLGKLRQHPEGWAAGLLHVSYDCLFGQQLWYDRYTLHPPPGFVPRRVFDAEGVWEVRAIVVSGRVVYRSAPVRIKVLGSRTKATADALDACAKSLDRGFSIPTGRPNAEDIALFTKYLPSLADTPAARPLRRYILLNEVATAPTAEARKAAVARVQEFRKKCPPLEQEYTDLLLGVAFVKAKDIAAARAVLRSSKDEISDIKQYLIRETAPKDDE